MKKSNRKQEKDILANELKSVLDYQYSLQWDKMECYANFIDALQLSLAKRENLKEKRKSLKEASHWYQEYMNLVYCDKQSSECLDVDFY